MNKAVSELNSSPTGARVLRALLQAEKAVFQLDLRDNNPNLLDNSSGIYYPNTDIVAVRGEDFATKNGAIALAHECLHAIQKDDHSPLSFTAKEVLDAETQPFFATRRF